MWVFTVLWLNITKASPNTYAKQQQWKVRFFSDVVIKSNESHHSYCRGVFDQIARYTMSCQESDLHLGLSSSLTSADKLNLPTPFYFFLLFSTVLYLLVQV